MISGAHIVLYSKDADADRAFFRDVLHFKSVDAGHGWLIFALPPSEAAIHPSDESRAHELYLMCDDLKAEMASSQTEASSALPFRSKDGVPSPRSNFPAEASLASINQNIQLPLP